jgi:hypothetical protein
MIRELSEAKPTREHDTSTPEQLGHQIEPLTANDAFDFKVTRPGDNFAPKTIDNASELDFPDIFKQQRDSDRDGGRGLERSGADAEEPLSLSNWHLRKASEPTSFSNPTHEDLSKANIETWKAYSDKNKPNELSAVPSSPDQIDTGDQHAKRMQERDQSDIDELGDKDLQVIGDVGNALQRGNIARAEEALRTAYGDNYDKNAIDNVGTGIRLELQRRGLAGTWEFQMTSGSKGAYGTFTDLRANGVQYPGLAYPNYSFKLGSPEGN